MASRQHARRNTTFVPCLAALLPTRCAPLLPAPPCRTCNTRVPCLGAPGHGGGVDGAVKDRLLTIFQLPLQRTDRRTLLTDEDMQKRACSNGTGHSPELSASTLFCTTRLPDQALLQS